jgi:hypothetical protein
MPWPKTVANWLRGHTRSDPAAAVATPQRRVFVLNSLIDMPTNYDMKRHAGTRDADPYWLDYNYINQSKTAECLSSLAEARATHGLDFSSKTLALVATGLHPAGTALIELAREFRDCHLFFELWNGLNEVVELSYANFANLYFLPVASRLRHQTADRVAPRPNRHVFVSLGGDDDLDLVRRVIARCPQLQFYLPDVSWAKPGSEKRFFEVQLSAANVTAVDCSAVRSQRQLSFSPHYRAAFDACDTVVIATLGDKMFQMRGGVRLADALYARKHIVITENPLCQLLMAQHERTCLVATHDPDDVAAQLTRICDGGFHVDTDTYEQIRQLTAEESKLPWMLRAAADPDSARRSVFARERDLLAATRRSLFARGRDVLESEVQEVRRRQR